MSRKNKSNKFVIKNELVSLAIKISAGIFCLVCLATIISTQATIVEKQNELKSLQSREEALIEENGCSLRSDDEEAFVAAPK